MIWATGLAGAGALLPPSFGGLAHFLTPAPR
jgi:hypothetical protein